MADDGKPALRLVRETEGKAQPVGTFPPGVANPLLLYFLETTVRVTAEATGGSPYYIRNRIREALIAADGGAEEAEGGRAVTLTPFAADPNRGTDRRRSPISPSACASIPSSRRGSSNFRPIPPAAGKAIMRRWC